MFFSRDKTLDQFSLDLLKTMERGLEEMLLAREKIVLNLKEVDRLIDNARNDVAEQRRKMGMEVTTP